MTKTKLSKEEQKCIDVVLYLITNQVEDQKLIAALKDYNEVMQPKDDPYCLDTLDSNKMSFLSSAIKLEKVLRAQGKETELLDNIEESILDIYHQMKKGTLWEIEDETTLQDYQLIRALITAFYAHPDWMKYMADLILYKLDFEEKREYIRMEEELINTL